MTNSNPEIGRSIHAGAIQTNYHDIGQGEPCTFDPLVLVPGVSAWAIGA